MIVVPCQPGNSSLRISVSSRVPTHLGELSTIAKKKREKERAPRMARPRNQSLKRFAAFGEKLCSGFRETLYSSSDRVFDPALQRGLRGGASAVRNNFAVLEDEER